LVPRIRSDPVLLEWTNSSELLLQVSRESGVALHRQIEASIRDGIRSGRLARGASLPPTRGLARELGVSRGVVVEAYQQLVAEGFLVSRQGSGTQVADLQPAAVAGPAAPDPASPSAIGYDLRVGTPDLSVFPRRAWLAAMRQALKVVPHEALGYGDPGGVPELRDELAAYLRRVRAADASADRLVVVNGVARGMHLAIRALARAASPSRTPQRAHPPAARGRRGRPPARPRRRPGD